MSAATTMAAAAMEPMEMPAIAPPERLLEDDEGGTGAVPLPGVWVDAEAVGEELVDEEDVVVREDEVVDDDEEVGLDDVDEVDERDEVDDVDDREVVAVERLDVVGVVNDCDEVEAVVELGRVAVDVG